MNQKYSFYWFAGLLLISLLLINTQFFKGNTSFLGVSYSDAYTINSDRAATIIRTYVSPGETVSAGDTLITLYSPELELDIEKLRKELILMESEIEEKNELLESELALFDSEKQQSTQSFNAEINQLAQRLALQKQLVGIESALGDSDQNNELELQIESLKQQLSLELQAIEIRVNDVTQEHLFDVSQIRARQELARQELQWKERMVDNLTRVAQADGVVERVYVKPQEQVDSFTPLLTLNPRHPTSIVGYLVGQKDRNKELGDTVLVRSSEQSSLISSGVITGFGSVVALPNILQNSSSITTFGLEIFIEIPEDNPLPVGEKVIIE
jgi:multidrug resistance efflux pump